MAIQPNPQASRNVTIRRLPRTPCRIRAVGGWADCPEVHAQIDRFLGAVHESARTRPTVRPDTPTQQLIGVGCGGD